MSENEIVLSVGVDIDGRILHAKCGLMFTRDTRIFRGYSFDPFFLLSSYQTLVNRKVIGPLRVYALVPVCLDILFPSVTVNVGLLPVRILKEFFGIRFC